LLVVIGYIVSNFPMMGILSDWRCDWTPKARPKLVMLIIFGLPPK